MRTVLLILIAALLGAGESAPAAGAPAAPAAIGDAQEAITRLARLPDPLAERQLADFFAGASAEDASRVLMQIAIAAMRPARPVVVPQLSHRDPLVVDRALRALAAIGWNSSAVREQVERLLSEGNPMVAAQAARCLGSGDDLRAVPALVRRLSSSDQEVAAATLAALQRLTRVDFKTDATAWEAWYQSYRQQAVERLKQHAERLGDSDTQRQIAAIQALGQMRSERQEALDLVEPFAASPVPAVSIAARQALATLAPGDHAMPAPAEVMAATRPAPIEAKPSGGVITYLASQGLFDTWYGLLLTAFTGVLVLSGVVWMLRTGPVKNATRRFGRVVVAGTMRFVRPATEKLQNGTKRIIRSFVAPKSDPGKKTP